MGGSIKLFSVFGIPVDINATWLIAFALITWSLSTAAFPSFFGLWSPTECWIAGVITTIFLFVSVLAHELGHSLVAISQGLRVRGITLLLFGGVSKIQGKATRPRNEFLIAFAGPAISFVIGASLIFWWIKFGPVYEDEVHLIHGVLFLTGWMNILVAGFNMLPGYPMDGGRVLRSAVWSFTGDSERASRVALRVGRIVFYLLIGWGVWQVLSGDVMGGIWIIFIGWFLMSSSRGEMQAEHAGSYDARSSKTSRLNQLDFEVRRAARAIPRMFDSSLSVEETVNQPIPSLPMASIPVARQGELIGFLVRRDLDFVPRERMAETTLGELMNPDSLRVISSDDTVYNALKSMDKHQVVHLVVMDGDYVVGMVTREDIIKAMTDTSNHE